MCPASKGATTKSPCGVGTYSATGTVTACSTCPSGYTTGNIVSAATACTACAPAKFDHDGQSATECKTCPDGWWQALPFWLRRSNQLNCEDCGAGYIVNAKKTTCTSCSPGEYESSHTGCSPCDVGKYSATGKGTSCTSCGDGHIVNAEKTKCTSCPAGRYEACRWACTDKALQGGPRLCNECVAAQGCAQCTAAQRPRAAAVPTGMLANELQRILKSHGVGQPARRASTPHGGFAPKKKTA